MSKKKKIPLNDAVKNRIKVVLVGKQHWDPQPRPCSWTQKEALEWGQQHQHKTRTILSLGAHSGLYVLCQCTAEEGPHFYVTQVRHFSRGQYRCRRCDILENPINEKLRDEIMFVLKGKTEDPPCFESTAEAKAWGEANKHPTKTIESLTAGSKLQVLCQCTAEEGPHFYVTRVRQLSRGCPRCAILENPINEKLRDEIMFVLKGKTEDLPCFESTAEAKAWGEANKHPTRTIESLTAGSGLQVLCQCTAEEGPHFYVAQVRQLSRGCPRCAILENPINEKLRDEIMFVLKGRTEDPPCFESTAEAKAWGEANKHPTRTIESLTAGSNLQSASALPRRAAPTSGLQGLCTLERAFSLPCVQWEKY